GSMKITNPSVKSLVLRFAEGRPMPKEFALSQNYPNPFNPTTRFNVDVPKTTNVDVIVYNILGQRVATLLSGIQSAGYHTVEWDGRDAHGLVVPSGMYFVRMTADQFTSVRKAMMLK
ncbi:MAG: FlgD immunoglobulin-like domain containing protein, partial [Bacteroidota bacterium]